MRIFLILLLFSYSSILFSQSVRLGNDIDTSHYKERIDNLEQEYGNNKVFIQKYKLQCLVALSKYSDLKEISISFKYRKLKTSLACRPKVSFFLRKKSKRKYNIFINDKSKNLEGILLKDVPFNEQVGVIAHEIAHVVDYSNKNNRDVLKTAFDYLSLKKREKIEKSVDSITIAHGFGWQLYKWADFIINKSDVTEKYKIYKKRIYLEPKEILEIIK